MGVDRVSSLTPSQRNYLRLVLEHKSSKQIAQQCGISVHTVDKRIKEAMRLLEVGSRVDAARMLAATEISPSDQLGPQLPDLAIRSAAVSLRDGAGWENEGRALSLGEKIGDDGLAPRQHAAQRPFPLPFPTSDRPENNLSVLQRLAWTIGLIIGLALATGILLSGVTALATLLLNLNR